MTTTLRAIALSTLCLGMGVTNVAKADCGDQSAVCNPVFDAVCIQKGCMVLTGTGHCCMEQTWTYACTEGGQSHYVTHRQLADGTQCAGVNNKIFCDGII
jgi:hypothetical protein